MDRVYPTIEQLLARFMADQLTWNDPVLIKRPDEQGPVVESRTFDTQKTSVALTEAAQRRILAEAERPPDSQATPLGGGWFTESQELSVDDVIPIRKRNRSGPFADRIGIGRANNVDVLIPLPRVSKYHAYAVIDRGSVTLCDAKSTFGTFVDGTPLDSLKPFPLEDGVRVLLGPYAFRFHTAEGFRQYVGRLAKVRG